MYQIPILISIDENENIVGTSTFNFEDKDRPYL